MQNSGKRPWAADARTGVALGLLARQVERLNARLDGLAEENRQLRGQLWRQDRRLKELTWAETFFSATEGSTWFRDKGLSPGRWALGYPALHALFRILDTRRPKDILELGLGQSTCVIGQYVAANVEARHCVVEHDREWIDLFESGFALSRRSEILALEREMVPFREAAEVRVFKGFDRAMEGRTFDFVCIDAPLGGDMRVYSRIDVLRLLRAF